MENALRANPLEIREQYEKQLKDLQEAYGEAMLELRGRKELAALMEREDGNRSGRSMRAFWRTGSRCRGPSSAPGSACRGGRSITSRPRLRRRSIPALPIRSRP